MAWNDRILEAAYTPPSGTRLTFTYENVSKTVDKKTASFEFPDADGTFVQDLGHSGRKYPLLIIFWGNDCDLEATVFEDALIERGTGKLEHPMYGTVDVVPFGTIKRRDDLKTAANQAIIQVTFWETIGLVYPSSQTDPSSDVLIAVDEYNSAGAEEFEEVIKLNTEEQKATFKGGYDLVKSSVKGGLQSVADTQADVKKQFDTVDKSISQGIDLLIGQPLTLAFQTLILVQSPARALTSITARLDAYSNLANSLINSDVLDGNEFHTKDLYASTYITGSIISVVNNQFTTRNEAIQAADVILAQMDALTVWRDENFANLEEIDTGGAYQQLLEAVSIAAGFLVDISFTLKQERSIILDRARTIVDLSGELYGSVDDQLDLIINTNDLSGSEILELPKGREILYYV